MRHRALAGKDLVLKLGGNALMPRGMAIPDQDVLAHLSEYVGSRIEDRQRSVIVPGGVGGHLFIEWARRNECSDSLMNDVGCRLIDLSALILSEILHETTGKKSCPQPARTLQELRTFTEQYPAVVSGATAQGAITSDSQAVLIAQALGWEPLLIKRELPFLDLAGSQPQAIDVVDLDIKRVRDEVFANAASSRPGWHPSIDPLALSIAERHQLPIWILATSGLNQTASATASDNPTLMRVGNA